MNKMLRVLRIVIVYVAAVLIGCATTQQANRGDVQRSGFLRDYSQLKPGNSDQALLRYVDPNARFAQYDKVMIDRVTVYTARNSDLKGAEKEDQMALATYFDAALREELGKKFRIVSRPGSDVLRVRAALTDADESEVLLDTVTTVMPAGLALSTLKRGATGSDSFVGFAQAEVEILDSVSSNRLAAAVDKRYGTKALRSKFGAWNHAKEAMDHWAEAIATRLEELKSGNK